MVTVEMILAELDNLVTDYSVHFMLKGSVDGDAGYSYGLARGQVKGLAKAKETIENMLEKAAALEQLKEMKQ